MTDYERLKNNITTLNIHGKIHKPVHHITNGEKYELQLICEMVEDVNALLCEIIRLQAENERLRKDSKDIDEFARNICKERLLQGKAIADFDSLLKYIKMQKVEAYKEFAERLKKKTFRFLDNDYYVVLAEDIDDLSKEMVGDDNAG